MDIFLEGKSRENIMIIVHTENSISFIYEKTLKYKRSIY